MRRIEECSAKNHERTICAEVGTIGCIKPHMLLRRWEVIMKKKNKWELSVMAWMNELVWKIRVRTSTWHHEVDIIILFFDVKAASEEHNVIRVLCGNMDFTSPFSCTGCAKWASRLRFRWQIGEKDPVHQIYMQDTHFLVPSFTSHALSHWLWYNIIHVGQRECISSRNFSEGFLSRTLLLLRHNECDGVSIVCSRFVQAQIKENIRALRH